MNENFIPSEEEENYRDENNFLKMKLMLEHGAEFSDLQPSGGLPAHVENEFLRNIMAYEKQAAELKKIKVFDRIGRPGHFRPVNEIADVEMESAWNSLDEYLHKYDIDVSVCSPNISKRELYRFVTEELFEYEMEDMYLPGMTTCFTYDEFHPDHVYENTRVAVEDCIRPIFRKEPLEWTTYLQKEKLRLNGHYPISDKEYMEIINRFKNAYDDIVLQEMDEPECTVEEAIYRIKGSYKAIGKLAGEEIHLQGDWLIEFEQDEDPGYWLISNVQIEGVKF